MIVIAQMKLYAFARINSQEPSSAVCFYEKRVCLGVS